MYYLCTFGTPGRRPDARRVSKARPLSQDLLNADLAVRHLSILMQDCWSQYRTEHFYICGWYQTDHHLRLPRRSIDISKKIHRHHRGGLILDCFLGRSFLTLIKIQLTKTLPLFFSDFFLTTFFRFRFALLYMSCCISILEKGPTTLSYDTWLTT